MTTTTNDFLDPLQLIPTIGVIIGMIVGLLGIWNSIKTRQEKTRADIDQSILDSEKRVKEYFDLKFSIFDIKLENVKQEIKTQDEVYTRKLEDRSKFFMGLLEKIERKLKRREKENED